MKKRLMSFMIAGVMMIALMPNALAAHTYYYKDRQGNTLQQVNYDPYTLTNAYECARLKTYVDNVNGVDVNNGMKANADDNGYSILQDVASIHYAEYLSMNFGTHSPKYIEVYASTWVDGRNVIVKTDEGTEIAKVPIPKTSGYSNFQTPHKVEITVPVTGTKNIQVTADGGSININKFRFEWQYETITGPTIAKTTTAVGASASIERDKENAESRNAKLLLCEYDANGSMVKIRQTADTAIANGGATTSFNIASETFGVGATGFGAYFLYSDDTEVKTADMQGVTAFSGTVSEQKLNASADNGWVTISGSNVENEDVFIAVVPQNYNSASSLFSQTSGLYQLYKTTVSGGKYNYKFKMPQTVATGNYKAVVKGKTVNECVEFSYTNPDDIYNVLFALDSSTEADTTANTLKNNADIFGITSEMFNDMQSADKAQLKSVVDAFFANNALVNKVDGDYSLWINGLKSVIAPEVVVSYIKNVKNTTNIIDYINKYKTELGIASDTKYTQYFDKCKQEIVSALVANTPQSANASNFVSLFDEAVIVGYFNAAESWGYAGEALINFSSDLAAATPSVTADKIALYRRLINAAKHDLMNKFVNRNFVTINQIASLFMSNIDSYNTPENVTNPKYDLEPSKVVDDGDFTMEVWHEIQKSDDSEQNIIKAFEDLDGYEWAKTSINYMRSIGVVTGKSDTTFAPADSITREEFAAIVTRAFGLGTGDVNILTFDDVDKGDWYAPYIAKAYEKGIVTGIDENTFGVGQNVTREQIAAMLHRATKAAGKNIIPTKERIGFTDFAQISDYAYDSVKTLALAQIINGTGNDKFSPKKSATRAEAVVMLHRLLTNIK